MERYIVKPSDLRDAIEKFPIEVVQRMCDCQIEQGNIPDVRVFQQNIAATKTEGGFNWDETSEGSNFWFTVIICRFNVFFERYPKTGSKGIGRFLKSSHKHDKRVYYRGDKERGAEILKALSELGGIDKHNLLGYNPEKLYYIGKDNIISCTYDDSLAAFLLQQNYTEAHLPEYPKETIKIGEDVYEVSEELKSALMNLKKVQL